VKNLVEINEESNEMMDRLVRQMAKKEGVTEQLKSDDWLLSSVYAPPHHPAGIVRTRTINPATDIKPAGQVPPA